MDKNKVNIAKRVVDFGKKLWQETFTGKKGRIITEWKFPERDPHARQVLNVVKGSSKQKMSISTCYAGAKAGEFPFFKETVTFLPNGEKRVNIFGVMNGKTYYAVGKPNDKNVQDICRIAYSANPSAKSLIYPGHNGRI